MARMSRPTEEPSRRDVQKVHPATPQRAKRRGGTNRTSCEPFALAIDFSERKSSSSNSEIERLASIRWASERCEIDTWEKARIDAPALGR